MNRLFFWSVCCLSLFCVLLSCSKGADRDDVGGAYWVRGTLSLDSTLMADNQLVLFSDNHRMLSQDTIVVTPDGTFEYEGHANGLSELYLCGPAGEYCRFFATGGMEIGLTLMASADKGVTVTYNRQSTDTINGWLKEKNALFEGQPSDTCRQLIDSLIRLNPSDIRTTILLRDQLAAIQDSLFVRQILGSLQDKAKPEWLKKSIDNVLSVLGSGKADQLNRRLLTASFELPDTVLDLSVSRPDYLLVCFWANNSSASVDSMRALSRLISTEFESKRVSFLSCCLYAEDSILWNGRIRFLDGQHTWVKGGFSDYRMRAWNITQVPSVILMDMYCNQTKKDVWGEELRKALNRIPTRFGYQKK